MKVGPVVSHDKVKLELTNVSSVFQKLSIVTYKCWKQLSTIL